eukprot:1158472-Pelagomonas_calceolata.AAC.8
MNHCAQGTGQPALGPRLGAEHAVSASCKAHACMWAHVRGRMCVGHKAAHVHMLSRMALHLMQCVQRGSTDRGVQIKRHGPPFYAMRTMWKHLQEVRSRGFKRHEGN